jgi:hypothetical protein
MYVGSNTSTTGNWVTIIEGLPKPSEDIIVVWSFVSAMLHLELADSFISSIKVTYYTIGAPDFGSSHM